MPNKIDHLSQYKKNKALAGSSLLKKNIYNEWRIVVIFYAVMHLIDSSYAINGVHPHTHCKRKDYLNNNENYEDIIDDYENLEMLSRKSRYDCVSILDTEVTDALINMNNVENFVNKMSS